MILVSFHMIPIFLMSRRTTICQKMVMMKYHLLVEFINFSRDLRTSFVDGPVRVPLHKELNITSTYVVMSKRCDRDIPTTWPIFFFLSLIKVQGFSFNYLEHLDTLTHFSWCALLTNKNKLNFPNSFSIYAFYRQLYQNTLY